MVGVGEMDSVITIKHYVITKDEATGKLSKAISKTLTKWAKVVQLSESKILQNAGIYYTSSYKITTLIDTQNKTKNNDIIILPSGEVLNVGAVIMKEIGRLWIEEITAYNE